MKNVEIKKSELALYKGLSMDLDQITAKLSSEHGVELKKSEIKEALDQFGLTKTRGDKKPKGEKAYQIILTNDCGETAVLNMDNKEVETPVVLDEEVNS